MLVNIPISTDFLRVRVLFSMIPVEGDPLITLQLQEPPLPSMKNQLQSVNGIQSCSGKK